MSLCNIFKEFSSGNNGQGIFFTFSQYAEDLTKENSLQSCHRVIPSKFACFDLNLSKLTATTAANLNKELPGYLQDYYENKISYFREQQIGGGHTWTDWDATKLLFQTLEKYELINKTPVDSTSSYYYYNELKYVGDINIYSNENVEGINYNEIYCMIPPEANNLIYTFIQDSSSPISYTIANAPTQINGWNVSPSTTPPVYPSNTGLLSDAIYDATDSQVSTTKIYYYKGDVPTILQNADDSTQYSSNGVDVFNFNCIVVFYDVYNGSNIETRNLPLGIWFSGDFEVSGTSPTITISLKNTVTKFVRSSSVFEQGTAYGLRICTKYIATPYTTSVVATVNNPNTDQFHTEFSEVCDEFNQSLITMNEIASEVSDQNQNMVEFLSQFQNKKTNVPYTKTINGLNYWFVNGKNTGVVAGILTQQDLSTFIQNVTDGVISNLGTRILPDPTNMNADDYILSINNNQWVISQDNKNRILPDPTNMNAGDYTISINANKEWVLTIE